MARGSVNPNPRRQTVADQEEVRSAQEQIAAEIMRVHQESYGHGAGRVTVHVLDDTVLVLLDDLELAESERTLIAAGRGDAVTGTRAAFQDTIRPTFVAVVERATGRRVASFHSFTRVDEPTYSAELFRLKPDDGPVLPEEG
jgi:uncharacterized protein YbcI